MEKENEITQVRENGQYEKIRFEVWTEIKIFKFPNYFLKSSFFH